MRLWSCAALLLTACISTGCATAPSPSPETSTLRFVVLGDTAYNQEGDGPFYEELVGMINQRAPAFSIHVGDTKGKGSCDDAFQTRVREGFGRFEGPLIYTPGDNEWTDCHSPQNGGADPVERLSAIRKIFFSEPLSLGKTRLPLRVQSADYPENRIWEAGGVVFATVHIVGSDNGRANLEEFTAREAAGLAWIAEAFSRANSTNAQAIVFAFQAELFRPSGAQEGGAQDGFRKTREAFMTLSTQYALPVLLVHGDAHTFKFDRPFYRSAGGDAFYQGRNLFRLQTFGAPELGAVEVTFSPGAAAPFSIAPIYGTQNPSLTLR